MRKRRKRGRRETWRTVAELNQEHLTKINRDFGISQIIGIGPTEVEMPAILFLRQVSFECNV